MKRKLLTLVIIALLTLAALTGCGKETVSATNHERPVFNLCASLSHNDGQAYLNCFMPSAKKAYLSSQEGAGKEGVAARVRENSKLGDGDNINCEVIGKTELTDEALTKLQREYKKNYSKNDKIEKAFQLTVTFEGPKSSVVKKLTVVMIDESWYIYGDVIEGFEF